MMNWKYFLNGFSSIIGSFVMNKNKINISNNVYSKTNKEIEDAWKTVGKSITDTLKLYG